MIEVGLFDKRSNCMPSLFLGADNKKVSPEFIRYACREMRDIVFIVDDMIEYAGEIDGKVKIGILTRENPNHRSYDIAPNIRDDLDCILTFMRDIVDIERDFMYYPCGGSYIKKSKWGMHAKTRNVSVIFDNKRADKSIYEMRKTIQAMISDKRLPIDVYRLDKSNNSNRTVAGLRDYRYSIVIENYASRGYFSHRFIDCVSQGTIPIYFGCSDIGEFFDARGIIGFKKANDLLEIIHDIVSEDDYIRRSKAASNNLDICERYFCSEDWIYRNYDFIFDELL